MGYFANGTSGQIFEAQFCEKCVHREGPDGKSGCAVMLAHLLYSYALCDEDGTPGKDILDMLIPHEPTTCNMFHEGPAKPGPGSLDGRTQFEDAPTIMPSMREWAKKHGLNVA